MTDNGKNLYWHKHSVSIEDRWEYYGYKSCIVWFTGLSASGKSTIANALCQKLHTINAKSYVLDGDNVRHGLCKDLGFSHEDRRENIRRIGEVGKLLVDAGLIVLTAFISPYRDDRDMVRNLMEKGQFIEVHVKCPLNECESRDPKGIYKKARAGAIKEFTGITSPYEEPLSPEVVLETNMLNIGECVNKLLNYLSDCGIIAPSKAEPLPSRAPSAEANLQG